MQHVVKKLSGEPLSIDQLVEYLLALAEVLTQLTLRIDQRRTLPSSSCPVLSVRKRFLQQ
jgi:hypothetical protein